MTEELTLSINKVLDDYESGVDHKENANATHDTLTKRDTYIINSFHKKHGLSIAVGADEHIRGAIQIHDLGNGMDRPYCCGHDLSMLLQKGLGIPGNTQSSPAQHMDTAVSQMIEMIQIMSNEFAGAQAFSNVNTLLAPFVYKDNLTMDEVVQNMQQLVYHLNYPSRQAFQVPFSNLSFDWNVPDDMKDEVYEWTDEYGVEHSVEYGDLQDELDMINMAFMEVLEGGDSNGKVFTFPIPTYSVESEGMFDMTDDVAGALWSLTAKFGSPYFMNYLGSGINPASRRAMCPLTNDTEVMVRSSKGVRVTEIKTIVNDMNRLGTEYDVWTPTGWASAKPVAVPMTDVYEVTMSNGAVIRMGENHLQPIMDGETLSARDLDVGMWLPFNKDEIVCDDIGDSELGFAVGAYIGDGSYTKGGIVYTICGEEKSDSVEKRLFDFWGTRMGCIVKMSRDKKNVRHIRINGFAADLMKHFVGGTNALDKHLTRHTLRTSADFKRGLLEGFRLTDGARASRRLYTSSDRMRKDMCILLSSLGERYNMSYVDTREGRLGTNPNYCVYYPTHNYGKLYKSDDDCLYYMITDIKCITRDNFQYNEQLYCFEVDTDEHIFMLANGLYTSNCRLNLDFDEIAEATGGVWNIGSGTGSIAITSINLNRCALEAGDNNIDGYFHNLQSLFWTCVEQCLQRKTHVFDAYSKGRLPYAQEYLADGSSDPLDAFRSFFLTIGIVGAYEAWVNLGFTDQELPYSQFATATINYIKDMLKYARGYESEHGFGNWKLWNLEQTPAEGCSPRFAALDIQHYPDAFVQGKCTGNVYLTNSTHLPVNTPVSPLEQAIYRGDTDRLYSGGTLFNWYTDEAASPESVCALVKMLCTKTKLPYVAYSPVVGTCPQCGDTVYGCSDGECPECGTEVELMTRVVGYIRPAAQFNAGQKQQYENRMYMKEDE